MAQGMSMISSVMLPAPPYADRTPIPEAAAREQSRNEQYAVMFAASKMLGHMLFGPFDVPYGDAGYKTTIVDQPGRRQGQSLRGSITTTSARQDAGLSVAV